MSQSNDRRFLLDLNAVTLPPLLKRLPWPLPALLAWGVWALGLKLDMPAIAALTLATLAGVALSVLGGNWWRRLIIGLGFPLSLGLAGAAVPDPGRGPE